jgi:hypothetical protein
VEECCFKILLNIWFNGTANHPHEVRDLEKEQQNDHNSSSKKQQEIMA